MDHGLQLKGGRAMLVEQAVFTSASTRRMRGYQIVAHSPGVSADSAQQLARWCPTHGAMLDSRPDAASVNCFSLGVSQYAISRSVYGGPEYSQRGSLQIVTLILLLTPDQLAGYEFNPLACAGTALALGYLRLQQALQQPLRAADLPDHPLPARSQVSRPAATDRSLLAEAQRRLATRERVALVGLTDPLAGVEELILRTDKRCRPQLSFTSGLKPSVDRPFAVHLLPSVDEALSKRLARLGVQTVFS